MAYLTEEKQKELQEIATKVRITVVEMLTEAGSGHLAGSLGMADIFTLLYFHVMTHDPKNPDLPERDRLVLSNGHITPIRYAAMAHAGYFPIEECMTLRKFGSRLQGHPERDLLPSVETTSGPLGSGLSQAAGIALGAKMDDRKFYTYCLMSDGEQQEGNTWEGAMFAAKYKLNRLIGIIDRNYIQITGNTEDVMPLEPFADKYRAFNWHVLEVDGHNMEAVSDAIQEAKSIADKPTVIIANTTPSKGIPSIERDYQWHGKPPKKDEKDKFIAEIIAAAK